MPLSERELESIRESISDLKTDAATARANIENLFGQVKTFVTKAEFGPVRLMTYGLAAAVLGSFVTNLLGKVFIK
jgi:hypothetical protein